MAQISRKKLQVLTLPGYVLYFLTALYFHISIGIFCNLFICLVFGGLLQSIGFRMFCSKHSITFDTYLLSCRFHCVDIFYVNFRSCETFTITNSRAILLLIKTPSNYEMLIYPIPANVCFRLVQIQMFYISRLAFLRFTFFLFIYFFSNPLFTQKEKLNLKTYNSTLLDIYGMSVGEKLKNLKRKENIIILKIYT